MFSGRIHEVTCPRIAVLGTDGAIGKRTTATVLTRALNDAGVRAVMVGTGQTSLIQGARYGVALDAIPAQFVTGELEAAVVEAFEAEHPDVIIVEGQGALSHPDLPELHGDPPRQPPRRRRSCSTHPARTTVSDFPNVPMPTVVERDQPHRDLRPDQGHRDHDQPRAHDRRRDLGRHRRLRGGARHPGHRRARPARRGLVDMVLGAFPALRADPVGDRR